MCIADKDISVYLEIFLLYIRPLLVPFIIYILSSFFDFVIFPVSSDDSNNERSREAQSFNEIINLEISAYKWILIIEIKTCLCMMPYFKLDTEINYWNLWDRHFQICSFLFSDVLPSQYYVHYSATTSEV